MVESTQVTIGASSSTDSVPSRSVLGTAESASSQGEDVNGGSPDGYQHDTQSGWSVILTGSRSISDVVSTSGAEMLLANAIEDSGFEVSEVVSGTARGGDQLGEKWAERRGIPIERFPADWDSHGRSAGPIRNQQMIEYADALVAVHVGDSKATGDKIDKARSTLGRERVEVVNIGGLSQWC